MSEKPKSETYENDQNRPGVHFKFNFSINVPPAVVVFAACLAGFILYLWVR